MKYLDLDIDVRQRIENQLNPFNPGKSEAVDDPYFADVYALKLYFEDDQEFQTMIYYGGESDTMEECTFSQWPPAIVTY